MTLGKSSAYIRRAWVVLLLIFVSLFQGKAGDSISVYVFLSETCPICQNQTLTLRQLYDEYAGKGISFVGLFPNQDLSTREGIQKFGRKYKIDFELRKDEQQKLTTQLAATVTPEVFVVNNATQKVLYKGKVDNSFEGIGKKRQVITKHYLQDALQSILEQKEVALKETPAVGCFIVKPD
ncbi:MAG TPA: redoxin family protein [Chitinophagales bacterium]|nr:redoxin family protein [Chitinophagales bacterium]